MTRRALRVAGKIVELPVLAGVLAAGLWTTSAGNLGAATVFAETDISLERNATSSYWWSYWWWNTFRNGQRIDVNQDGQDDLQFFRSETRQFNGSVLGSLQVQALSGRSLGFTSRGRFLEEGSLVTHFDSRYTNRVTLLDALESPNGNVQVRGGLWRNLALDGDFRAFIGVTQGQSSRWWRGSSSATYSWLQLDVDPLGRGAITALGHESQRGQYATIGAGRPAETTLVATPLPAGAVLILSAMGGLMVLRKRSAKT